MVLASYIRLALVGAALLFSQAQARFDFTPCVHNCVTSSGCESDSARCMCREARELLLDSVISCLFFNCKDDLRDFEVAFLDPIEEGCDDSDRDIPRSKLRAAESLASSYIGKIPSPTTAKSTVTPPPKPTKKPDPTTAEEPSPSTTATTEDSAPSSTSTVNRQPEESSSTTAAVTPAVVPDPATQSSAAPSESPTPDDSGSGGGRPGGGDPFSTPGGSVGSAIQPFFALLGLPVVVALLALE
jgi:hypothetical protein